MLESVPVIGGSGLVEGAEGPAQAAREGQYVKLIDESTTERVPEIALPEPTGDFPRADGSL